MTPSAPAKYTPRSRARRNASRDEGVALLLSLLCIVLLTAIIVEFSYEMQVEATYTGNAFDEFETRIAAESAIAQGLALLAGDVTGADAVGASVDYDCLEDIWALGIPYESINNAVFQCSVDDEYGKLNLNALYQRDEGGEQASDEPDERLAEILRILFEARGAEEDPVDAILDWLDADDEPQPEGAENEYYASLDVPYPCKNGAMDAVEELLLIRGITPEIFFGDPELDEVPLTELLTVHGHSQGRINANTAERELLAAVFEQRDGDAGIADSIVEEREEQPFESLDDLVRAGYEDQSAEESQATSSQPGGEQEAAYAPLLDVAGHVFRIRGDAQGREAHVRIEAYVWRNVAAEETAEPFRVLDWREVR